MKTTTALAVPIVMDEGDRFLRAEETLPDQVYRCPACQETLIRKAGSRKILHFSHRGQTDCNGETALHAAAKRTVYQVVTDWLAGKAEPPTIQGRCHGLSLVYEDEDLSWNSGWDCSALVKFPLRRDKVDECVMEEPLEDGLLPDLTFRLNGKDILGIEIKVTHEVDSAKRERLDIWWVELDAGAVLQNRLDWKPRQHNIEKLRRCAFCSQFDEG